MSRRHHFLLAFLACIVVGCKMDQGPSTANGRVLWASYGLVSPGVPATDGGGAHMYFMTLGRQATAVGADGSLVWASSSATGDPAASPATITGASGGCVVASVVMCGDNDLVAFGVADGAYAWRATVRLAGCAGACAAMAVSDTSAYVPGNFGPPGNVGVLTAVSVRTGSARWGAVGTGANSPVVAAVADTGIVVVLFADATTPTRTGAVVALAPASGTVRWRTHLPSSATAATGAALWQSAVLASANDGKLYALDRSSGAILWNAAGLDTSYTQFIASACPFGTQPQPMIVAGSNLFVATAAGALAMYDLNGHTLTSRTAPVSSGGYNLGWPLTADSSAVYVVGVTGEVAAYSTVDAHLVRTYTAPQDHVCGVAVGSDRIFAVGTQGVYAFAKQ